MFGDTTDGASAQAYERFLRSVPDCSEEDWSITLADTEAAAVATTDTTPGPDGLPYVLYRGTDWTASFLWTMYRGTVDSHVNSCAQEFGMYVSSMMPKAGNDATPEGVSARVDRARPISCCTTDYNIIMMAYGRVFNRLCESRSPESRMVFRPAGLLGS